MRYLVFVFLFSCSSAPVVIDLVKETVEGLRKKEPKGVPKEPERLYSTPEEVEEVVQEEEAEMCRMEKQGVLFKREMEVCE